ncbi:hypothetical protein [Pseudoduganella namucuonensis]|nr:hypothetical protein [Pseudoduganella namucuonensis]
MGLFSFARRARAGSIQRDMRAAELGRGLVAMRVEGEFRAPPGCVEVVFSAGGQARRVPAARAGADERAYCFHPGPYAVEFAPYEGAPELGLQLRFVIDAADPRVAQQRFDLYLFSEVEDALPVAAAGAAIEDAVREALAQGTLDLPPCTTLQEWNAFRAGLNQLLYTRFGVTVDDCIPVDLGERVDYAAMLRARAAVSAPAVPPVDATASAEPAAVESVSPTASNQALAPDAAPPNAASPAHAPATAKLATAAPPPAASPTAASTQDALPAAAWSHVVSPTAASVQDVVPDAAPPHVASPTVTSVQDAPPAAVSPHAASGTGQHRAPAPDTTPGPDAGRASARGGAPAGPWPKQSAPTDTAHADARALRRLFLELPYLSSGLRLLPLPPGQPLFVAHRNLLQRIAVIALDVNTMPSLAWAAPDQPLARDQQARRALHTQLAAQALDQAWALLARMQLAAAMQCCEGEMGALLDDADRLVSNLDFHLGQRRVAHASAADARREPTL